MAKHSKPTTTDELAEEDAWVKDQPYMFFIPGGFTMMGWYVKPLTLGMHRFRNVRHLRNAGNVELPALSRSGPGLQTVWTKSSWRYYDCTPFGKAPWDGKIPAGWEAGDDS